MKLRLAVLASVLLQIAGGGAGRQVAITIDDLPRGGDGGPRSLAEIRALTERLLRLLRDQKSRTKGMAAKGEPDPPRWVQDAWARTR